MKPTFFATPDDMRAWLNEQHATAQELLAGFYKKGKAWEFFQAQPAWYRRTATWWVISAKREETWQKRMAQLIDDSAHGRTIAPLTRAKKQGKQGEKLPHAKNAKNAKKSRESNHG